MQPEDIGRLVTVSDPVLAPDGTTVAYVVTRVDLPANRSPAAIWLADVDGSASPRQLTSGRHSDGSPRWSPDGTRLAFASDRGADEAHRQGLYLLPLSGPGEVVALHEGPEPVDNPCWSPDGRRLAFATRVRQDRYDTPTKERPPLHVDRLFARLDDVGWIVDRPKQVFVVPADGSAPARTVTTGDRDHEQPAWSPDGRRLAVVAALHEDADLDVVNDLHVVDVDATDGPHPGADPSPVRRITATDAYWQLPAWSPDGNRLAALGYPRSLGHRHPQVTLIDVDGCAVDRPDGDGRDVDGADVDGPDVGGRDIESGRFEQVSGALDRSCAPYPGARPPVWTGDGIVFAVEDAGAVHVYRWSRDDGLTGLVEGERLVTGYDAVGKTVAFTAATQTRPSELSVCVDGDERRLTSHQDAFLAACPPAPHEVLRVTSEDGTELDAWVALPPGLDRSVPTPTLVMVHGGPHTQYGHGFFDETQLWTGAGFVVVLVNPHGATGGTEAFARSVLSPLSPEDPGTGWGGIDYRDVLAAADAAAALPYVDGDRMGILGGSYGGYMTSWAVGHTDRFAAACSERAVNNLLSLEWSSDVNGFFRFELGVSHLDHPEEFTRMSPVTYVRDITTPLLILHSEHDLRCHIEQADAMFTALRMLRRDVTYYRFPDEGHELSRSGSPRHRVQRAELIAGWFRERLPEPTAQAVRSQ